MIYLDMDGVLCDFIGGICAAHGRPNPYDDPANRGIWDVCGIWGMHPAEFWEPCEFEFWANLKPTPEARRLLSMEGVVGIITSPSQNHGCIPGKLEWLKRHTNGLHRKVIFTHAKYLAAAPGKVLYDDNDDHVVKWREAGGVAVQVPRPWNSLHPFQTGDDNAG